jgi:Cu(I)/Ag(I) efflux system membrane fusion protein
MIVQAPHPNLSSLARLLVLACACALLCLAAGCSQEADTAKDTAAKGDAAETTGGKLVLYACPMNDIPPLPAPGKCPVCGMELTPVVMGDIEPGAAAHSHLDPHQALVAGLRTAPVEKRYVTATVQIYGQVEYDDAFIVDINAPTNGIVDTVYIRRVGEYIRLDQKLFDFYSAEIFDVESEMLDVAKLIPDYVSSRIGVPVNPALRNAIATPPTPQEVQDAQRRFAVLNSKLHSFGLLYRDINQVLRLEQLPGIVSVRMPNLTSNVGGVIIENKAVQGDYVNKGTRLVQIADPHYVWASFDAFEQDFPWLRVGQEVEFTSPARPGEDFWGRINMIEPVFDEKNRTFRVGVSYYDVDTLLRPNMSLRGTVRTLVDKEGRPTKEGLSPELAPLIIPETAPLVTGKRAVVYVAVAGKPGVFEGREIVLGPKADGYYVVLAGLAEGEQVLVNGAFKLDSERQILAKPSMLKPEGLVRQNDFGRAVAPLPTSTNEQVSQRPKEPSPEPNFPPAEIFAPSRIGTSTPQSTAPAYGLKPWYTRERRPVPRAPGQ